MSAQPNNILQFPREEPTLAQLMTHWHAAVAEGQSAELRRTLIASVIVEQVRAVRDEPELWALVAKALEV